MVFNHIYAGHFGDDNDMTAVKQRLDVTDHCLQDKHVGAKHN